MVTLATYPCKRGKAGRQASTSTTPFSPQRDDSRERPAPTYMQVDSNRTGPISDGYHTFDELYEHRHALFLCLLSCHAGIFPAWMSRQHDDGTEMPGWFIAGIELPTGVVSYHLPERLWPVCKHCEARVMDRAPIWDGHTSMDVIKRLIQFVKV